MKKSSEIDMLHGPLVGKLLRFTLPIALSSVLQQLFNAADTAVVGRFGDARALAAVGTNTEIVALVVAFSSGLSIGVNVLIADRLGRQKKEDLPSIVRTAILLALLAGLAVSLSGFFAAAPLLHLIRTPKEIIVPATQYLQVYLIGYPFLLIYDFGSAALRANGNSRYPFVVLMISGAANVVLNLFFVIVLKMGVIGVALATDLSTMFSALTVVRRLAKDPLFRLRIRLTGRSVESLPVSSSQSFKSFFAKTTRKILEVGIPSALQGAVFCFANIFVQASVNRFGQSAIAGSTIAMNFEYFIYYVVTAFGQTTTTFISQNFAAQNVPRCRKIHRLCLWLSVLCSSVPIFLIVLLRVPFSGLFSSDAAAIENSCVRILCTVLFESVCSFYEIPAGVLRGSGHALYPAAATVTGTCVFRIVWIFTVFRMHPALPVLYHAFPLSWAATTLLMGIGYWKIKPLGTASEQACRQKRGLQI